jgi:hypothetical protein
LQADEEKQLFETFRDLSKKLSGNKKVRHTKDRAERARHLDAFLNIDKETQLLITVKDIQDEISTILLVLTDQLGVLNRFIDLANSLSKKKKCIDKAKYLEDHQMITTNIRDFGKMASQAKKTEDSVSALDLWSTLLRNLLPSFAASQR